MTAPVRVQLSRAKGWRMPPNTVKVDRSTKWGNPFVVGPECASLTAEEATAKFRQHIANMGGFWSWGRGRFVGMPLITIEVIQTELRGKNLACWCKPGSPCHADVLLEIANSSDPLVELWEAARAALVLLESFGPDSEQADDEFVAVRTRLRDVIRPLVRANP